MEGADDDAEREGSDNENEAGDEGGDQTKAEYVKKEYYPRPYVSPYTTEAEVKSFTIKN